MKNSKLLLLGVTLVSALGVVGCGNTVPETNPLEDAASYIFQLYRTPEVTGADYSVVNSLQLEIGTFNVEWGIELAEGVPEEAVTLTKGDTSTKVAPNVPLATTNDTPYSYTLIANVSDADGNEIVRKFNKEVPKAPLVTVAEFSKLEVGTYCRIEGVVSAVNKIGANDSFVVTDSTGSTFAYDKTCTVELGRKYTFLTMRSDYSGFPQMGKPSIFGEPGAANQLSTVISEDKLTTITATKAKEICSSYASNKEATIKAYASKYFKITEGYLVKNSKGNYGVDIVQSTTETTESLVVNLYYHTKADLASMLNTQVDVYGAIRGFGSNYLTIQGLYVVPAGQAVTF